MVEGYPGAEFKGFRERKEAEDYVGPALLSGNGGSAEEACISENGNSAEEVCVSGNGSLEKEACVSGSSGSEETEAERRKASGERTEVKLKDAPEEWPEPGTLLAYVDGSYDHSLKKYAFGCVFILPERRIYTEYGNGEKEQGLQHRNVTGEMLGAMYAVRTAMASGFSGVELRYDYEGIEKWVTGEWRSKTELTGKYALAMREWGKSIRISFARVPAHSNVYYNELADRTAKSGLREGQGTPRVRSLYEDGT